MSNSKSTITERSNCFHLFVPAVLRLINFSVDFNVYGLIENFVLAGAADIVEFHAEDREDVPMEIDSQEEKVAANVS